MTDCATWLRRYVLVFVVGLAVLLVPLLWFAAVRAWLSGTWTVTLAFDRLGEGPLEVVILTLPIPVTWFALLALHELLREADRDVDDPGH